MAKSNELIAKFEAIDKKKMEPLNKKSNQLDIKCDEVDKKKVERLNKKSNELVVDLDEMDTEKMEPLNTKANELVEEFCQKLMKGATEKAALKKEQLSEESLSKGAATDADELSEKSALMNLEQLSSPEEYEERIQQKKRKKTVVDSKNVNSELQMLLAKKRAAFSQHCNENGEPNTFGSTQNLGSTQKPTTKNASRVRYVDQCPPADQSPPGIQYTTQKSSACPAPIIMRSALRYTETSTLT